MNTTGTEIVPGVVPGEKFVTDLIAAPTVVETGRLAQSEIHRATGRYVALMLTTGDPREMKRVALSLVHWFRLHPEMELDWFWVKPMERDQAQASYGSTTQVILNAHLFGAGRPTRERGSRRLGREPRNPRPGEPYRRAGQPKRYEDTTGPAVRMDAFGDSATPQPRGSPAGRAGRRRGRYRHGDGCGSW